MLIVDPGATTTATTAPTAAAAATAQPLSPADQIAVDQIYAWLSVGIWATAVVGMMVVAAFVLASRQQMTQPAPVDDKRLEQARITYGFWLIIAALLLTLAVITLTVNLFHPQQVGTADIIAIVSTVSGILGTLTAAFFGIQAAGAGRSQALSTLDKLQSQIAPSRTVDKIQPAYGPHIGNTRVSITGNGLKEATAVNFGSTPGENFEMVNDGLIQVTTPAIDRKAKSEVDVTIIFPGAGDKNISAGTFYCYTLVPADGPIVGGTPVQIIGTNLSGAQKVMFGKSEGTDVRVDDDGYLCATTPGYKDIAKEVGVDVTVVFAAQSTTNSFVVGRFDYKNKVDVAAQLSAATAGNGSKSN